jgi:hypothetical protein
MKHASQWHRTLVASVAAAALTAPAAQARPIGAQAASASAHTASVEPARNGGQLLGEEWVNGLSGRTAAYAGTCTMLARHVLVSHYADGTATCTATPASRLFVFFGSFCSAAEDPSLTTERAQRECAVDGDRAMQHMNVAVDGLQPIDIVGRRFEVVSPQRSVVLPSENPPFGLPPGPTTFTAHGWAALIGDLRHGRHTITIEIVAPDWGGSFRFTTVLDVAGGHDR